MGQELRGKVVLVTGASRGIGASVARALLGEGAAVACHYRRGREAAEAVAAEGGRERGVALGADLAGRDGADELWRQAVAWKGRIDILINNAAAVVPVTADAGDREWRRAWDEAVQVNLLAVADLCRRAVFHFRERGGGIIINVASRAAFRGDDPHLMHYAASKGGVVALTRSIARGYARDNVLAYLVAPGFVRVERQEEVIRSRGLDAMLADVPLGEMAGPEDVAHVVAFLASGQARHATGATIDVNGASYFH
jgi:NAD(P)-dependent dehydrogenase (short-subunit alcohol dehydrogenase family)